MIKSKPKKSFNYLVQVIDPTVLVRGDYCRTIIEEFRTIDQAIAHLDQLDTVKRVDPKWHEWARGDLPPYEWAHIGRDGIRYIIIPNPEKDVNLC